MEKNSKGSKIGKGDVNKMKEIKLYLCKYVNDEKIEIDIDEYVSDFDIDALSLVDENTLMYNERKCNISIVGMFNEIDSIKEMIEEKVNTKYGNFYNQMEYDLNYDGSNTTDRLIKFLVPFYEKDISGYNATYNKIVFPASYNPDTHGISLCPVRNYDEEEYNSYDNEYVIEKPFFYNFFIEARSGNEIVYFGVCEIDGYSYNPKNDTLKMSFTDATGVIIRCINKLKNIQTYYQNVPYSGIKLNDLSGIIPYIVNGIYPDIFKRISFSPNIRLYVNYDAGKESNPDGSYSQALTKYTVAINYENTNTSIKVIEFYGSYRNYAYYTINNNRYYQDKLNFLKKTIDNNNVSIKIHELFEYQGSFYLEDRTIHIHINKNNLGIGNSVEDAVITEEITTITKMFDEVEDTYEDYLELLENDGYLLFYNNEQWLSNSLYSQLNYTLYRKMFSGNTSFEDENVDTNIDEIQNLCNSEGFNKNPDTSTAIKVLMLSRCRSMVSYGNMVRFPLFRYKNNVITIDDEYIEDISMSKSSYEKPLLDSIESITDWKNKKIKQKIESKIGLMTDPFIDKYDISLIYTDDINMSIGDIIHIESLDNGIISMTNINIVITSIKYETNKARIEGYGIQTATR